MPASASSSPSPSLAPGPLLRRLVTLGPHAGAHRAAARAGIAIGVPLVALELTGHIDLALYAVFGAFTALYGRDHTHGTRLRMQATAALALIACVVLGTAIAVSPLRDWLIVPVAAVVAGALTLAADALDWHPPGALFFVFALAACASVPAEPVGVLVALALAGASAAFAMLVSGAGIAHPAARRREPTRLRVSLRAALARPGERTKIAGLAVAVLVAGAVPTVSGLGHPYWAMVSAVAALSAADIAGHLVRAGHRVLGTLAGVALAAALLALSTVPLVLVLFAVLLQVGAELFVMRNYGLAMVFVTPLALIMSYLAHPGSEWALLGDRTLETLLGTAVGLAVSAVVALTRRGRSPRAPVVP
ncbi:FUSC family protein [Herbiconiux moechotypicola]|uniref:FUSC family protein n=1 Tax=Herbiconiux moechotypicola TaxID=637393 RepID=A0ABP5QEX9_9MICO|nr:FUSC family protein [Herbiconiux moechotypicola]MCS5729938.1 FUSC family protein [Herbiconiux moechotypicola]